MSVRGVGVDIADVDRMARLLVARGGAFTGKWFDPEEVADCVRRPDRARAFAEHFAVKEAVWKALGADAWDGPLAWRSIVYRRGALRPVVLQGRAAALAERVGQGLAIHASVTSYARIAVATAIVTG